MCTEFIKVVVATDIYCQYILIKLSAVIGRFITSISISKYLGQVESNFSILTSSYCVLMKPLYYSIYWFD